MIVERLTWDSDFFGYEIGKIDLKNNMSLDYEEFLKSASKFKLVYIFCKTTIDFDHFDKVDEKIILDKNVGFEFEDKNNNGIKIQSFNENDHSLVEIKKLALESGIYSRFYLDKNFKQKEFEKLYISWIEQSINKKIAFDVIVATDVDNTILGFITLNKKNENIAEIGLVAVSEASRGKGIARKLLNYSFKKTKKLGFETIQVVTQNENIPAMKLYESVGFEIKEKTFVYHYWNI